MGDDDYKIRQFAPVIDGVDSTRPHRVAVALDDGTWWASRKRIPLQPNSASLTSPPSPPTPRGKKVAGSLTSSPASWPSSHRGGIRGAVL
jgi:hypothetical protein